MQMILNSALYWVLFANEINSINSETGSGETKSLKAAILIFIPYIMMALNFVLLYVQLEDMQRAARV